ncbi:MAG: LamG-like jellyroll fold domain-containing protein [Bacteroidota bacterium]|nr:LamG-like jellyroll fold domain-containing protein [Bacteroidota bacterium]
MKSIFTTVFILVFTLFFAKAQPLPAYVDTAGLVAWYPFKGNANDISGKGNNGNIFGSAAFKSDRFGQPLEAIYLDGSNDYISVPRNSSLEPTTGLTINAWITPERMENIGWRTLISKAHTPGVDPYVSFSIQTSKNAPINHKWQFNLSNGTMGSLKSLVATKAYPDKDTLMLTAVFGNGEMKLYINGKLDTSLAFTGNIGYSNQNLLIGYSSGGPNEYFKGSIDELGIWNRALTPSQLEKLFISAACKPKFPINTSKPVYELNDQALINSELFPSRNYQWQANPLNLGWINITNNASYAGATSNGLSINAMQVGHHNLRLRLIAKNEQCHDTSAVKELQVRYCLADTFYVNGNANSDTLFISILASLNQTEKLINKIRVYPNPAANELNFVLDKPGFYKAELTGIAGSVQITTNGNVMDISSLQAGVYVLRIFDDKNRLVSTNKISIIR